MSYKTEMKTTPMEGRFAWCYLGKPRTEDMNGKKLDNPKYECAFYFPKTNPDPQQCRNYGFFAGLAWEVVANVYRGQWPMIDAQSGRWIDWPIDDCDVPAIRDKYPWAAGMWRVALSGGLYRPKVFDSGNNPIELAMDGKFRPGTFKGDDGLGGDWGMASVNAYEWNFGSRRGVSFGCEGIKVTRLDEQLGGGGRTGEQMFGAPTGQPVFGAAPPQAAPPPLPQPTWNAPSAGYAPPPQSQPSYAPNPPQAPGPYAPPVASAPPPASAPYAPPSPAPGSATGYLSNPAQQPYAPPPAGAAMPPQPPMSGGYGAPPAAPAYVPPIGQR